MKTIDISTRSRALKEVLELAGEESLLLRTADGREFVLAEVDDLEHEVELVCKNKELMDFLAERSRETTTYTLDEIKKSLKLGSSRRK